MAEENTNEPNVLDIIATKLDSFGELFKDLEKRIIVMEKRDTITEPNEETPKEDARIPKAEGILRVVLKDSFPKEKLDSWNLDQLIQANDIKETFIPKDKEDIEGLPEAPRANIQNLQNVDPFKFARPPQDTSGVLGILNGTAQNDEVNL